MPEGLGAYQIDVELRFQPIGYRWAYNLRPIDAPEPKAFLEYVAAMSSSASSVVQHVVIDAQR